MQIRQFCMRMKKIFNEDIKEYISSLKIEIRPYMSFYSDLKVIKAENHVLIDSRNSNYLIKNEFTG